MRERERERERVRVKEKKRTTKKNTCYYRTQPVPAVTNIKGNACVCLCLAFVQVKQKFEEKQTIDGKFFT